MTDHMTPREKKYVAGVCVVCKREHDGGTLQCAECLTRPRGRDLVGTPRVKVKAPGSTPTGTMNKTEAAWARRLDADPAVRAWHYEEVKVRVGMERAWYTPDFFVEYRDGTYGFDEVKGAHVRDKGRARFQAAARLHPWARWRMWQMESTYLWKCVYDYRQEKAA
jgi:hypothetical protein